MRLGLILGEAGSGLRRNVSMVISVILVTFISLTFVGAAILLQFQIGQMKGYWYDRAQVAVYMCTDVDNTGNCTQAAATEAQIGNIEAQLNSPTLAPFIEKYEFETHDQAYANFQEQFADNPIAAFVTPGDLNESFRVNLVDPTNADVLIESLSGSAGVQAVEDQRGLLDQIFSILNAASYTAIGVAALMLVAAVLLIATTIRLSAFSRRRELGIMRLVGASNRLIQTPFILEGVFASLISANEVNDGNFTWAVPAALAEGRDYTLRISSITNLVATSDLSDRNFSVSGATFPLADSLPHGWFKPGGSSKAWRVAKSAAYEGTRSLVSSKTQDGRSSGIAYRSNFADGSVSFYMRVSSEQGFDHGRFYINNQLQSFENAGAVTGLSGKTGWVFASFPVSAGDHTFKWTFEKDDSYAGLDDSAWLDGVSLPETTQEIAVADPQGVDVVSGSSTTSFPGVPIRSTGAPQVFTITNRGQADLHGIRIIQVGAAASEFVVRNLGKTFLAPGASTTFEVVSAPTVFGARSAGIQILSNDADESAFAIALEGSGLGIPILTVSLADDVPLVDQAKAIGFGSQVVGRSGKTRTFTVRNGGSSELNGLAVVLQGKSKDFIVGPLGAVTLAPGASTDFSVTFRPQAPQVRLAALKLTSNDSATGRFDIKLSGKGVPKSSNSAASHATAATGSAVQAGALSLPSTSVDVVDGQKFLALTATKPPGISGIAATIEVSSNLIDWLSGNQHTTVVIDNAAILKVRDNTPISPGGKRYIRLR